MCIDKQAPLTQVLRILCLQCLVAGGLPTKYYDTVCQDIVQVGLFPIILGPSSSYSIFLLFFLVDLRIPTWPHPA